MKKAIGTFLVVSLLISSCSRNPGEPRARSGKNNERIEITPFIVNKVILLDTTQIKTMYAQSDSGKMTLSEYDSYFSQPCLYFNKLQFEQLKSVVWRLVRDPKSKVYPGLGTSPYEAKALRDRVIVCDSVAESAFDEKGKEVITMRWMCDSTMIVSEINMIQFFESWYFNPENNMIERETLGYTVLQYVKEKEAYKYLFYVFRDEEAVKKAKKYCPDL